MADYKVFIKGSIEEECLHIDNAKNAVLVFESVDWEGLIVKANVQKSRGLNFTYPTMQIVNNERVLTIEACGDGSFEIDYNNNGRGDFFIVSANVKAGIAQENVQSIINRFILRQLKEYDKEIKEEFQGNVNLGRFSLFKYLGVYLRLPVLLIITIYGFFYWESDIFKLTLMGSVLLGIIDLPSLFVLLQYKRLSKVVKAKIDLKNKKIKLSLSQDSFTIRFDDIERCVYTYCSERQYASFMGNVAIQTHKGNRFVLSSLYYTEEELKNILRIISRKYYSYERKIPFASFRTEDDYIPVSKEQKANVRELTDLYKNYSDDKLVEIILNKEKYQKVAVETALSELKKRKLRKPI